MASRLFLGWLLNSVSIRSRRVGGGLLFWISLLEKKQNKNICSLDHQIIHRVPLCCSASKQIYLILPMWNSKHKNRCTWFNTDSLPHVMSWSCFRDMRGKHLIEAPKIMYFFCVCFFFGECRMMRCNWVFEYRHKLNRIQLPPVIECFSSWVTLIKWVERKKLLIV